MTRRIPQLLLLAAGITALTHGQDGSPPLVFEVASIKPADPNARSSGFRFLPGGGIQISNAHLKQIIGFTYDVREFQISGGPGWLASTRYDILAKPEGSGGPASLSNVPDKQRTVVQQQIRERLRALLVERFQLTIHKETRELPVYALVVGKGGPKMEESKEGDGSPQSMRNSSSSGKSVMTATRTSMQMLANSLSNTLGGPVLDQTGLKAHYDLKMEWAPDLAARGPDTEKPEAIPADPSGPSIFTAIQQQLGLKLESQKGPVEIIVIDRAEKASEN